MMDATAITLLGSAIWPVIQPFVSAGLTKATEKIGESIPGKIWEIVKGKFEGKPEAKKVLVDLQASPKDEDVQGAFRYQLKQMLKEDETFATELSKLLSAAGSDYKAQVIGGGAVAQGNGATAVGQGGIYIGGNAGDVNSEKKK
jgi:hypothetical protein